ncbi:transcriptional regulator [Mangrovactinospora gilvigrisea]|uniref:Transcriptional regulator n=1 Tax=Mangrovactinospora gilvigrisea TaxID=1428644 RepID=A0A1J7BGI6_9ACTN|nr:helix-turn-helix transcriptional regulator [Mangrovactinospora gilvigrisea]OIV37677.1 transcriptional regulator [Mangrovactinospora gilvigrisea]
MATVSRRRADLREFLRSRRARVSPADVGLPDGGARRRTPGLRREEVAVLAGVGTSWYQWLEQGRDITVSPQVLDAVARVLRLSPAERRHLYVLAGLNPPLPDADEGRPPGDGVCEVLDRILEAWMPNPANIVDRYWEQIAMNPVARQIFPATGPTSNCLVSFFTSPVYRERYPRWKEIGAASVAQFRGDAARFPDDTGFCELADRLGAQCPEFAELWARQDVAEGGTTRKEVSHPEVGLLELESTRMRVPERPDLTIVLHLPVPGSGTEAKLRHLAAARPPLHAVAG